MCSDRKNRISRGNAAITHLLATMGSENKSINVSRCLPRCFSCVPLIRERKKEREGMKEKKKRKGEKEGKENTLNSNSGEIYFRENVIIALAGI